jgi:hypothetical protein
MTNIGIEELKQLGFVVSAMITEYFYSPKLLACQVKINMLHKNSNGKVTMDYWFEKFKHKVKLFFQEKEFTVRRSK